jgi:GMP synthase (glutamine-hydrolysing)
VTDEAVAITHVPFEDLGSLAEVLAEKQFSVQTLDACTAKLAAFDFLKPRLLVILGGPIGAYETSVYPFLTPEILGIRRRLEARLPTLGICLGAQLMAVALGGTLYPGTNGKEIGWSSVTAGLEAAACPAVSELFAPGVRVLHWHGDTFEVPPGAAHLASSQQYPNQAFAVGHHALALQFHPEVQAADLERWYVGHACELGAARIDVARLRADSQQQAPLLQQAARRLWRRWLDAAV